MFHLRNLTYNFAGAVISLGGCNDQTVHSDTAHLFTCGHDLPPHYMNLFLISPDNAVSPLNGRKLVLVL